ncbi:MAG TPA: hypothetical protein VGG75_33275 [Trebonia sp.]
MTSSRSAWSSRACAASTAARACPGRLFLHDDVVPVVRVPPAAELLRDRHAHDPDLAQLREELARDVPELLPVGVWNDRTWSRVTLTAEAEGRHALDVGVGRRPRSRLAVREQADDGVRGQRRVQVRSVAAQIGERCPERGGESLAGVVLTGLGPLPVPQDGQRGGGGLAAGPGQLTRHPAADLAVGSILLAHLMLQVAGGTACRSGASPQGRRPAAAGRHHPRMKELHSP